MRAGREGGGAHLMMSLTSTITWIFVVRPPREWLGRDPFLRAPALCWWALTIVASIMAYSLSGSSAKVLKSLSQTPLTAQREKRLCVLHQPPKRSGKSRHGVPIGISRSPRRRKDDCPDRCCNASDANAVIRELQHLVGCILRKSRCRPRWSPWSAIRPERTVEEHKPAGHAGGFFFGGCCGRRAVDGCEAFVPTFFGAFDAARRVKREASLLEEGAVWTN
jgi:hypothetical protein